MHSRLLRLPLILLLLSVSACGFSLRGSDVLSARYAELQLLTLEPNSEFNRLLRRSLESAAVEIEILTDTGATDPERLVLAVGDEQLARRPVTVNSRARAAQYEMRLSVDMLLARGETEIIPLQTLSVERSYFEDIGNIAGSQEEVEIITTEMRRELVNQLLRRLQAPALGT